MKNLIFKNGYGVYEDNTPYIIVDGAVEITLSLPQLSGEFFFESRYINDKSNVTTKTRRVTNQDSIIRLSDVGEGKIEGVLRHYLRGEHIANYPCETLILKVCDKSVIAIPEIAEIRAENQKMEEKLDILYNAFFELKDILSGWEKDIAALTKFAYDDYKSNVYLDGKDDIAEFKNKYGFNTEEEK